MENVRKSPGYAESQIRLLLSELSNSSHAVRIKAVKNFQNYIDNYAPEIYDDDVDFLYTGFNTEANAYTTQGLLYYSGLKSEKHDGQLKRICAPTVALIRWLITFKGYDEEGIGNIFYDRFVALSENELIKISFVKHIIHAEKDSNNMLKVKSMTGESRSGSEEDAMELLSFLVRDHRSPNGEPEPVDLNLLIENNKACRDKFLKWLQKTATEQMNTALSLESISNKKIIKIIRPKTWSEVQFKPVPLQEDETGVLESIDEIAADYKAPVPDPLGLQEIDLRVAQELHDGAFKSKKGTGGGGGKDARGSFSVLNPVDKIAIMARIERVQGDENQRSSTAAGAAAGSNAHQYLDEKLDELEEGRDSLLPIDKNFSPTLFLTFVHSNASFNELLQGSKHLEDLLDQQSSRRVTIVREHFGLFVLCAESLEWLKLVRKAGGGTEGGEDSEEAGLGSISTRVVRAQGLLHTAKSEAQNNLAPLLFRHKRSKEIRKAEQELRNISSVIEIPQKMRTYFDNEQFEEVVTIYTKLIKLYKSMNASDGGASVQIISRIKTKADNIMEELKSECASIMKQPGKVPDVERIIQYWKVLCTFESIGRENSSELTAQQLVHLRTTFDGYMSFFMDLFKKFYEEMKTTGAQALISGHGLNAELATGMYDSVRDTDELSRRKNKRQENSDAVTDDDQSVSQYSDQQGFDVTRNEGEDEEEADFDIDLTELVAAPGEKSIDYTRKLCFEVRLSALRKIVDTLDAWLTSLHDLALLVSPTAQKNLFSTSTSTSASKKTAITGNLARTPASTVLSKEVLKVSALCANLVRGMTESSTVAWGPSDGVLAHLNFTSPLSGKYVTAAYDEVFAVYELLSNLNLTTQGDGGGMASSKGPGLEARSLYNEAVLLLREIVIEGELMTATNTFKLVDLKVSTILLTLERAVDPEEKQLDSSGYVFKQVETTSYLVRASNDFEIIVLRTLRKLYAQSNRPQWMAEVVKDGLIKTFQKLLGCLHKVVLQSDFDNPAVLMEMLGSKDEFDFDQIEALLKNAETSQERKSFKRIFETIRICIYLRALLIPKIMQEITVVTVEKVLVRTNSIGGRLKSYSSISATENDSAARIGASMSQELTAIVSNLEVSVIVRYLEIKAWTSRNKVSTQYYNLIMKYASFSPESKDFPLIGLLLELGEERQYIEKMFENRLYLYTDTNSGPDRRHVDVDGYGSILFSELCKHLASFYVDIVIGLFTGSIMNVLDMKPSGSIVLPLWNKKEIFSRRKSEIEKMVQPRQAPTRTKNNVPAPTCPWPLLFERAVCESNYLAKIVKSNNLKVSKLLDSFVTKSIPLSQLQVEVDANAFYGRSISNLRDQPLLEKKASSLSLLLS